MTASPVIPRHPLDHDNVVKILLSTAASEAIAKAGKHHLAIIAPAGSTAPPEANGRMVRHVIPTDKDALDRAFGVIRGTHRATKIKTPPAAPAAPLTPHELAYHWDNLMSVCTACHARIEANVRKVTHE